MNRTYLVLLVILSSLFLGACANQEGATSGVQILSQSAMTGDDSQLPPDNTMPTPTPSATPAPTPPVVVAPTPLPASVPIPPQPIVNGRFQQVTNPTFAGTPNEFSDPILRLVGSISQLGCRTGHSLGFFPAKMTSRCARCPTNSVYSGISGNCEACPSYFDLVAHEINATGTPVLVNGALVFAAAPKCVYNPPPPPPPDSGGGG